MKQMTRWIVGSIIHHVVVGPLVFLKDRVLLVLICLACVMIWNPPAGTGSEPGVTAMAKIATTDGRRIDIYSDVEARTLTTRDRESQEVISTYQYESVKVDIEQALSFYCANKRKKNLKDKLVC